MQLSDILSPKLTLRDPIRIHGLGAVPIVDDNLYDLTRVELLEEALDKGLVKVSEVSESGEVPFLLVENNGKHPLLILEGEELVGGKQNRVVNTSILILAGHSLKIPVSCMEAGRWRGQDSAFQSGRAIFRAKSRAVHKASVTDSVRSGGTYFSDQGAVWNEVSASLAEYAKPSATSDFRAGREAVTHRIEAFVEAVRPAEGQVGAIFLTSSGIVGGEMICTQELFRRSIQKIVRSFAFEALSSPDLESVSIGELETWWSRILEAEVTRHDSPGTGEDIRLRTREAIGSGLYWNQLMIHFSFFPEINAEQGSQRSGSRRVSASERRSRMSNR
jgi:hypothetical protein